MCISWVICDGLDGESRDGVVDIIELMRWGSNKVAKLSLVSFPLK